MSTIILTGIIILLLFVLSDYIDDVKLYKDKYKLNAHKAFRAEKELYEVKRQLVKLKRINEHLEQEQSKAKQITMNVNVDTDEVVSKVMQGVNKKIEDINKQEQVFIKVDGKEININEVKKMMKKVGKEI